MPREMMEEHLYQAWKHLVRAYNTAKNAKKYDTAGTIASAIAEASVSLEWAEASEAHTHDDLEDSEVGEPPFKKGQRVRVKPDAGTLYHGCAGVVESATLGWGVARNTWQVKVILDGCDSPVPFNPEVLEVFEGSPTK